MFPRLTLKRLLTALTPALLLGCAPTDTAQEATPRAFDPSDADPALWRVADADTTIYLFGTVHLLKPNLVWFDDAVAEAFNASDTLVLEMVEPPVAEAQRVAMELGFDRSGRTLRSRLDDAQRARFDKAMTDNALRVEQFDQLQPWYAAVALSLVPMQKLGFSQNAGGERSLTVRAREAGKTLVGLETMQQQLGFFANMPEANQIAYLMSVVDGMGEYTSMMDRMERSWATGDVDALTALLNESLKEMPEVGETLLTQRNARWAAWIDERMETPGTVFVAVGAGHLGGPDSVQAMLKKRGIEARRVQY